MSQRTKPLSHVCEFLGVKAPTDEAVVKIYQAYLLRRRAYRAGDRDQPKRLASAQRFKLEKRIARVSMIWAASKSEVRTMPSCVC